MARVSPRHAGTNLSDGSEPVFNRLRNRCDRAQNLRRDLVGIALGIRTAIFEVSPVAIGDKAVRHADRRTAIGDAIAELMDGLGLVLAGQAQMVVRSVYGNMLIAGGFERSHDLFEIILAADFAHIVRREVGMHAGTIPIGITERLAMVFDVDTVLFAQTLQEIARHPDFVRGLLGALAENLEFPLSLGHFGIDAFVVQTGSKTDIEMFFDDLAGDIADIAVADARIIRALGRREAGLGEAGSSIPTPSVGEMAPWST